jgi:hypothetical protein
MMAVVDVKEKWSGETAGSSNEARTARRIYQVTVDDPNNDTPVVARLATGIPRKGQSYNKGSLIDAYMTVQTVTANRITPTYYEVNVDYSTARASTLPDDSQSPLDQPPQRSFQMRTSTEPLYSGWNDADALVPITSTAGEQFDGLPPQEVYDIVYVVTRNQSAFDVTQAYQYQGAINTDNFLGAAPGQAKIIDIRADEVITPSLTYWRATYQVALREGIPTTGGDSTTGPAKAWWIRLLNVGLRCFNAASPTKTTECLDSNKRPVSSPVRLKADGTQASLTDPTDKSYVAFRPQFSRKLPFAALNLV